MKSKLSNLQEKLEGMNVELDVASDSIVSDLTEFADLLEQVGRIRAAKRVNAAAKIVVDLKESRYNPPKISRNGSDDENSGMPEIN